MKVKKIKETPLHIQIMHALRLDFAERDVMVFHCPNGGKREGFEAATLQKMGVLPGVADLVFNWPLAVEEDGQKRLWMETGYIEIKTPDGELSDDQIIFRQRVKAMGGKYAVARCYEEVRAILIEWGVKCLRRVQL